MDESILPPDLMHIVVEYAKPEPIRVWTAKNGILECHYYDSMGTKLGHEVTQLRHEHNSMVSFYEDIVYIIEGSVYEARLVEYNITLSSQRVYPPFPYIGDNVIPLRVDNHLFVLCGVGSKFYGYYFLNDEWVKLPDCDIRWWMSVRAVGQGCFYLTTSFDVMIWRYDITEKTWSSLPKPENKWVTIMPIREQICGLTREDYTWRLHTYTDRWTCISEVPVRGTQHFVYTIGDRLYLWDHSEPVDYYDTVTGTWAGFSIDLFTHGHNILGITPYYTI